MVISELKEREEAQGLSYTREEEEQLFKKKHHNLLYKILRLNPIDSLNDGWRNLLKRLGLLEKHDELQWWAAYIYVREIMRRIWSYKIERVDGDLPPEYGPGIIIGNHQSHLDPFFIGGCIPHRIHWMSKEENFQTPIMRTLFKNLSAFKVRRGKSDARAWEKAKEILKKGDWVGIFPEGTRTMDGSLGEFHTGAVRLAIEMGVPILPTYIVGSRDALPKGKLMMKPAKVTCRVGKPIYYTDYIEGKISYQDAKRLSDELREEVVKLQKGIGLRKKENDKPNELSIGSPKDMAKPRSSGGFMSKLKRFGKDMMQLVDDVWYSFLKSLEAFDLRYQFQEVIQHFSGDLVTNWSDLMMPYRVIDYEKYVPKEGPMLVCTNHNSEWDVIILATSLINKSNRVLYQMAKQSLFKMPIVNAWIRNHHAFPLKRGQSDVGSYLYAKNRLENGELVVIYPEGTTNEGGGKLLPGHTGAMRLAIEAKVPILPIGITGTEDIFPKHAKMLNFGKGCILRAGEPFREHEKYFDKPMPNYEELKRLTDNMMKYIESLLYYKNSEM